MPPLPLFWLQLVFPSSTLSPSSAQLRRGHPNVSASASCRRRSRANLDRQGESADRFGLRPGLLRALSANCLTVYANACK